MSVGPNNYFVAERDRKPEYHWLVVYFLLVCKSLGTTSPRLIRPTISLHCPTPQSHNCVGASRPRGMPASEHAYAIWHTTATDTAGPGSTPRFSLHLCSLHFVLLVAQAGVMTTVPNSLLSFYGLRATSSKGQWIIARQYRHAPQQ